MKRITVIGATGMIGIPVTKELVKAGFEVTALVRNIEKAKQIFPTGIRFVKGDLDNKNSIAEVLKDAEGVYLNLSVKPTDKEGDFISEEAGLDNILSVAQGMNIKRIGYLSSLIARDSKTDWWAMKLKREAIRKIKNCGIPYTIFYPSNFMENFESGFLQGSKFTIMGKPLYSYWWIAGEDLGRQVATAFQLDIAKNKDYAVQGPQGLEMKAAGVIVIANYKKKQLSMSNAPMGLMKFIGMFVKPLKFVTNLMTIVNTTPEKFESQKTWDELGKPTVTVEKYTKQLGSTTFRVG